MPKKVLIVDAYSSGSELGKALMQAGVELFHLQSCVNIAKVFLDTFEANIFTHDLGVFPAHKDETFESHLESLQLDHIIAGTETGVKLAESLAASLDLPTNMPRHAGARRNKFEMIEAVKQADLLTARHHLCATREEVERQLNKEQCFPVVVKPAQSAGSDAVVIAQNFQAVMLAAEAILGKSNQLGSSNSHCVIESYLEGEEYIVDLIVNNQKIVVNDVCLSKKMISSAGHPSYDYIEVIPFDDPVAQSCIKYVCSTLEPLGLRFGAVHAEVKMTPEGPALIEAGARLAGAHLPSTLRSATNHSSIDSYCDLLLDSKKFFARSQSECLLKEHTCLLFLNSPYWGILESQPKLGEFGDLRCAARLEWSLKIGDNLKATTDLFSAPGVIILRSKNADLIQQARLRIREAEARVFDSHVRHEFKSS